MTSTETGIIQTIVDTWAAKTESGEFNGVAYMGAIRFLGVKYKSDSEVLGAAIVIHVGFLAYCTIDSNGNGRLFRLTNI